MAKGSTTTQAKIGLGARIVANHPYKTLMIVAILGIAILFLFLIIAFQITKNPDLLPVNFKLPKYFLISTLVLMLSVVPLHPLSRFYKEDKVLAIRNNLLATFALGFLFFILQFLAWKELSVLGVKFTGNVSGSYLYLISGLHLVHLLGGLIFLYVELIRIWQKSKDPVKCLIYFTDPFQRLKLELIRLYWVFMDVLWIALFFYFLFSF